MFLVRLKHKEQFEVHRQERLFELCERRHCYAWAFNLPSVPPPTPSPREGSAPPSLLSSEAPSCATSISESDSVAVITGLAPNVCGQIAARTLGKLPLCDRIQATKYTGLRFEVRARALFSSSVFYHMAGSWQPMFQTSCTLSWSSCTGYHFPQTNILGFASRATKNMLAVQTFPGVS